MARFTGIRFYSREKNSWTDLLRLRVGFDASYVLDKMTDSANITFGVSEEPDYLKINMWAALFIEAESKEFEFNADGTPKNHDQYIIGGYQYHKTVAGYEVSIKLIEPIERFRGILGETLSYTNQTTKMQDGTTYRKDPYNYYTALKRWLQVTPANTDNISRDSEDKDPNGIAWWNRITILDKDFLSKLPFADDTFNELTLYDLLFDVYDSGTGRTPVAYFDLNTQTGNPKRADRDEYLLKFIRQDGADKPILNWEDLTYCNRNLAEVCTGIMKREDGANYATGLVANVTNLSPNTVVTFPAQGVYAVPEVLSDVRDTKSFNQLAKDKINFAQSDWGIIVPHRIKKVNKLIEFSIQASEQVQEINHQNVSFYNVERIHNVLNIVESKQLSVLNSKELNFYEEGNNIIYLAKYAYKESVANSSSVDSKFYYVEYEPLIDARIQVGDSEYVQQINQTASQVDSDKFGKFMQDYLDGMAKADFTIQRTTEDPQKFLGYFGSRVKRGDKIYMITNIALRNRNFQYDVFFQLNENHVRKNMCYMAPQNIRANTAIQYDNILDRKIYIGENMKLGLYPVENNLKYLKDKNILLNMLGIYVNKSNYPQFANVVNRSTLKDQNNESEQKIIARSTNIAAFATNNGVNINLTFENNAISTKAKIIEHIQDTEGAGVIKKWYDSFNRVSEQVPILYVDAFGEVEKTSVNIVSILNGDLSDYDDGNGAYPDPTEYNKSIEFLDVVTKLPYGVDGQTIIEIPNLNIQKDMLEKYNFTYGVKIKGQDGIEVCSDLIKRCRLVAPLSTVGRVRIDAYSNYDFSGDTESRILTTVKVKETDNFIEYDCSDMPFNIMPLSLIIKVRDSSREDWVDVLTINNYNNNDLRNQLRIYF